MDNSDVMEDNPAPSEDDTPIVWRVNKMRYLIGFVCCYLILSELLYFVIKERDAGPVLFMVGPILAAPGWKFLWLVLSGGGFRLYTDRLDYTSGESTRSIALKDVIMLQSSLVKEPKPNVSIILATSKLRCVIPRWCSMDSEKIFGELCKRVAEQQVSMHAIDATPDDCEYSESLDRTSWARYPDMPRELHNLVNDLRESGSDNGVLIFRAPCEKPARTPERHFREYSLWMAVLSLVYAGAVVMQGKGGMIGQSDSAQIAMAFAFLGGFSWILGLISLGRSRKNWFVLHSEGVVFFGDRQSGEISWEHVRSLKMIQERRPVDTAFRKSGTYQLLIIETVQGGRISVPDIYDAPLLVISHAADEYFRKYLGHSKKITFSAQ